MKITHFNEKGQLNRKAYIIKGTIKVLTCLLDQSNKVKKKKIIIKFLPLLQGTALGARSFPHPEKKELPEKW